MVLSRMGVDVSDQIIPPPIPDGFDELMAVFWQLRRRAGETELGISPITFGALCNWQDLYEVKLLPFEIDLLFDLDDAAMTLIRETTEVSS